MNINFYQVIFPRLFFVVLCSCIFLSRVTVASTTTTTGDYINLGDISMYVEQHGKGEPIIFLHGGMGSAASWANQVEFFSKNYRVITPESRGQARTSDSKAALTYHLMAEDTVRLMDNLKISSAYIVGWSDGGNIGIDMAIHHPGRVKKLVAYGANINPAGLQNHFLHYLRSVSPEKMQRDNGSDYLAVSATPEHLPVIVEKIRVMWLAEPKFSATDLAKITSPVLIMDGQQEELIRPEHAKEIAALIPKAQLLMLPNVGHYGTFKTPKQWNEAVASFLKAN